MDVSAPASLLLSTTDARVLAVLSGTTKGLSGRAVAQLAEMSHGSVWRSLRRLVEHGLVSEEEAGGRTFLYRLNRDHLAADPVIALTRLRATLVHRIEDAIGAWRVRPVHAWMFGSAARGDGNTESDVDVLVIRPRDVDEEDPVWREQVTELADAIYRWTGNHAGIADISESEIVRLKKARPPVVEDVVADGVSLYGGSASSVFGRGR